MWDSVRDYWVTFNEPLEGVLAFMYLDAKGLVTTGMGNLIDASHTELSEPSAEEREASHALAAELAWLRADDTPASYDEIVQEWDAVKSRMDLAPAGGGHFAPPVTSLHLDSGEIDRIVGEKLVQNENYLVGRAEFSDFANWPADAQLGLLSMSWALGPAFRFPKFQAFAASRDWEGAAEECTFGPHVGTINTRNALDQQAFHNATRVDAEGLDPSELLIAQ
ncbi:hypothetical protein AB0E69_21365 [Kribbella sp. NPDC026611]|uniref:hypothetical protein n=1 Tax=Kribbella sp. NPDC026611 TaxID=3154911 RepID=UPI0033F2D1AE